MSYTTVKTPIVYYGGKTSMMNHIMPLIPEHDVYTEAFFGGGAVFFSKTPCRNETINDTLDLVVNFFQTLRKNFRELRREINATLISRSVHSKAIGLIRAHTPGAFAKSSKAYRVLMAWAFWVCTNFAFSNKIGGGQKFSNDVSVSVPATMQKRKAQFTEQLAERIEGAYIENSDALYVLNSRNVPWAFHFIDPPYVGSDMGHYPGYTEEQYRQLLDWCAHVCKGRFMLTNYPSELLSDYCAANDWFIKTIKRKRNMGIHSRKRDKTELIITNFQSINPNQYQLKF